MANINTNLQCQMAEEAQLLTEERWIIQALNLIKQERNSLQVERLQLESLKMQKMYGTRVLNQNKLEPEATASVVELMKTFKDNKVNKTDVEDTEMFCNTEKLDFATTSSVFIEVPAMKYAETEEEDDEDIMDINMLIDSKYDKDEDNKDTYILSDAFQTQDNFFGPY